MKRRLFLLATVLTCLVTIATVTTVVLPKTASAAPATANQAPEITCGDFDLDWLACPIIKGMTAATSALDNFINKQMSIGSDGDSSDPNQIFCNSDSRGDSRKSCEAYYGAWSTVRNIALGLMVVAGIIILIAQAIGMEILDAYTIRKVLPGFLIAALGITLSWQLMQFFVLFSNELAFGVRFIIYAPFVGFDDATLGGGSGAVTGVLSIVALNAIGWVGILAFLGTALLAVMVAVLILILRDLLIILLIIAAPVAIAMYILPNTKKLYKLWWESFSKALLMFALIAGLIAIGRVFAAISITRSDSPIAQLAGFAAYFLPYFLIPATFKFAGGALRTIGGFVNDRSKGGFDRLRKTRQENTARRMKAARSGGIYRDDFMKFGKKGRSVGKMANKLGNWTYDFDEQSRVSLGQSRIPGGRAIFGRSADIMKGQIEDQQIAQSKKALQEIGGLHYSAGRALGGQMQYFTGTRNSDGSWTGGDAGLKQPVRDQLLQEFGSVNDDGSVSWRAPIGKKDVETLGSLLSTGGESSTMAAQELLAKAPLLGNFKGAGKEETQRADLETMGLMAAAQAGRLETDEIAATRKISNKNIDQPGYGSKRAALLQQLATQKRNEQREGHGIQYRAVKDAAGNIVQDPKTRQPMMEAYSVYEDPFSDKAQAAIMSMTSNDIASSKSETIDAIADTMVVGASNYKHIMVKDPSGKKRYIQTTKLKYGQERQRAQAMQDRIKYLAMYSQGDSDAGRKLANVMQKIDLKVPPPRTDGSPATLPGVAPAGPPPGPGEQGGAP